MKSQSDSRRLFTVLTLFTATVAVLFALTWGEVLYRTAFIISHVVPGAPQWFEWGKYEVQMQRVEFTDSKGGNGQVLQSNPVKHVVYIYLPQDIERSSFVIFVPGFTPEGALDPRLVNLAKSFAGAGVGVAVPDSQTIRKRIFSVQDIDLIVDTFHFLQEKEYVDGKGIGLSGFSIAGSYALIAASELGDKPLFVLSLGGYFNLMELFIEVISKEAAYKSNKRPWEPDPLPKEVVFNVLVNQIGERKADELLEKSLTFDEAERYVKSLPKGFLSEFNRLSPSSAISRIKARVFLMHDINDDIIPVEESRKIRDALPEDTNVSYTEFSILRHVTPKTFLSTDILKFSWQVLSIVKLLL